jgi:tryptophanyl-tRNA synthetase
MSKLKSPQEKKRASLSKDRRNMYGESPHSSRKNIKRGKQNQHQEERRTSNQVLAVLNAQSSEDQMISTEVESEVQAKINRLRGFKKQADRPLNEFLRRQTSRRKRQGMVPRPKGE